MNNSEKVDAYIKAEMPPIKVYADLVMEHMYHRPCGASSYMFNGKRKRGFPDKLMDDHGFTKPK